MLKILAVSLALTLAFEEGFALAWGLRGRRELGLVAVQRFFLLDSMALENIEKDLARDASDLIEVLPGLMPKMIRRLVQDTGKPVIAGGLISDKEDVTGALGAGAVAVSTTNPAVWSM